LNNNIQNTQSLEEKNSTVNNSENNQQNSNGINQSSPLYPNLVNFFNSVNTNNEQKALHISEWINTQLLLDEESKINRNNQQTHPQKHHPIQPSRREIYTAEMGSNVGTEFQDLHPVLILQNNTGNLFGNTTIVLPITEDKGKYDKHIHLRIYNTDFESTVRNGLDKDPSRIKIADITTIDKARLKTKIGKVTEEFMGIVERKLQNLIFKD
jgi:mRNA-degrading endonuclease toxin of MazEF toxin-antitoxin module